MSCGQVRGDFTRKPAPGSSGGFSVAPVDGIGVFRDLRVRNQRRREQQEGQCGHDRDAPGGNEQPQDIDEKQRGCRVEGTLQRNQRPRLRDGGRVDGGVDPVEGVLAIPKLPYRPSFLPESVSEVGRDLLVICD